MSDLSDAYDRAVRKSIDAGLFTADDIASEKGADLLHAIKCDQRDRIIRLGIPGLVAPNDYDYSENSVLRAVQKNFNDVAGLNDVRGPLQAAAEETLAVLAAKGTAGEKFETPAAGKSSGDGTMKATENALAAIFDRGHLWPQCFGFDQAPDFNHNVFVALQLRFMSKIPGFSAAAEQLEYDKKVVRNIHEVNNTPGLSDIRPVLDEAVEKTLADAGLKPAARMVVPRTVQLRTK